MSFKFFLKLNEKWMNIHFYAINEIQLSMVVCLTSHQNGMQMNLFCILLHLSNCSISTRHSATSFPSNTYNNTSAFSSFDSTSSSFHFNSTLSSNSINSMFPNTTLIPSLVGYRQNNPIEDDQDN